MQTFVFYWKCENYSPDSQSSWHSRQRQYKFPKQRARIVGINNGKCEQHTDVTLPAVDGEELRTHNSAYNEPLGSITSGLNLLQRAFMACQQSSIFNSCCSSESLYRLMWLPQFARKGLDSCQPSVRDAADWQSTGSRDNSSSLSQHLSLSGCVCVCGLVSCAGWSEGLVGGAQRVSACIRSQELLFTWAEAPNHSTQQNEGQIITNNPPKKNSLDWTVTNKREAPGLNRFNPIKLLWVWKKDSSSLLLYFLMIHACMLMHFRIRMGKKNI